MTSLIKGIRLVMPLILLSNQIYALSQGSLLCLYNYSPNLYELSTADINNSDWADKINRPENLDRQVLGGKFPSGLPGKEAPHRTLIIAIFMVTQIGNAAHFISVEERLISIPKHIRHY